MMKKKILKVLAIVGCAAILIAGSIAGTFAYLTSLTGTVTNTFTAGNVKITLDEAKVTVYGEKDGDTRVQTNEYKLIPGHSYLKDPTIHVAADSEDCWLFVKVENGLSGIEATGDTTIASQLLAKGWTLVEGNVYAYNTEVSAGTDIKVFDSFKISGNADVSGYTSATINVTAYAVQADGFTTAAAAWAAASTSWNN